MSIHRRAAKRDANEGEIVDALEQVGANVYRLSAENVPDLLVIRDGLSFLIEVKVPGEKLTPGQEDFFKHLRPQCGGVAWTVEDALHIIGAIE